MAGHVHFVDITKNVLYHTFVYKVKRTDDDGDIASFVHGVNSELTNVMV